MANLPERTHFGNGIKLDPGCYSCDWSDSERLMSHELDSNFQIQTTN